MTRFWKPPEPICPDWASAYTSQRSSDQGVLGSLHPDRAGDEEAPEFGIDGGGNPCPSTGVDLGPGAVTALAQISLKKEHDARLFHFFISMSPVRVSPLPDLKVGGGEG